jgi:hypothetical protein
MPVWRITSITSITSIKEEPEVKLADWRVFEVQQASRTGRTRHLVGSVGWHFDGQVSSAIVNFDPATRSGLSESGRVYRLVGRGSGIGMNASYVWNHWKRRAEATDVVDVTPEIEALLATAQLKAAIEVGVADSEAGSFADFTSKEALSAHLAALRATEKPDRLQVLLTAPRGEPLDLPRDRPDVEGN